MSAEQRQPPRLDTSVVQDESSDDHFSSASEGDGSKSPIPITRVERVDDSAAHGEVPGTPAYNLRTQDAVPDEVEVVPEGRRPRSGTTTSRSRAGSHLSAGSRPGTPGGSPVPKTVVERVDDKPAYGEVDGTPAKDMRMADAMPDEVRKAPEEARTADGSDATDEPVDEEGRQAWFRSMWEGGDEEIVQSQPRGEQREQEQEADDQDDDEVEDNDNADDFGDDFDDFAGGDGDDFGDFDEAEDETPMATAPTPAPPQPPPPDILDGLPTLNFSTLNSPSQISASIQPYLTAILPPSQTDLLPPKTSLPPAPTAKETHPFLSDRSLSLWQQLVSPPPMQPPNWTRSRIRRLFLVSLGVPVDLDEILPPSKQKRLVLPSLEGLDGTTPRPSTQLERLKEEGRGGSTASLDSKTGAPKPRTKRTTVQKGPPPPPDFDTNAATLLCLTTPEAMAGWSDDELRGHVEVLGRLNADASGVLEYWLVRRDEAVREKEALEGVVGNLVGWVKRGRGRGR